MDLRNFLWKNNIKSKDFAREVRMSLNTLSLISNGKNSPSLLNAINIVKSSKGEIGLETLVRKVDQPRIFKNEDTSSQEEIIEALEERLRTIRETLHQIETCHYPLSTKLEHNK